MSTRTIRYIGPFPEGVAVATGLGTEVVVEHGGTIEVGAGQAEALLLQAANWEAVEASADDDPPKDTEPADAPADDAPKGASRKRG